MDLDAEMAQLQAEAQRRLREREEEERQLLCAAPAPLETSPSARGGAGSAEAGSAANLDPEAALKRLQQAASLAAGVASASASAQQTVAAARKLSLLHKLGLATVGLIALLISWKLFLRPVVEGLVGVALLVLLLVGIGKLVARIGRKDADADAEEGES